MANLPPPKTRRRTSFCPKYLWFSLSFVFLLNLLAASVPGRVAVSVVPDDKPLLPGAGLDKELGGGQAHTYKISVASPNQYLRVVIEQQGINIVAVLYDFADGGRLPGRGPFDRKVGERGSIYDRHRRFARRKTAGH
jgi:hypothetical protein